MMMTRLIFRAAAALLAACPALATASAAAPIEGQWANPQHSVTVRIARCGPAWCGRVIHANARARQAAAAAGTPHLVGTELMSGLRPTGDGQWSGTMFVPDRNIRAEGSVRMIGPRTLEVQGCAVGGLVCKSQNWTRVGGATPSRRGH